MTRATHRFRICHAVFAAACLLAIAGCGGSGSSGSSEYVDNVTADTSLAKYVATSRIATAPGVLTLLPVSCYLPPIGTSAKWSAVPAWFLSGAADSTVRPSNVAQNYKALLAANPTATPRITLYVGVGHDANSVNKTYSPESNDNTFVTTFDGIALVPYSNVYDWFLQYRRM